MLRITRGSSRWAFIWLSALACAVTAGLAAAADDAAAAADPQQVIRQTSDDLLSLIEEARGYVDEDPDRFYTAVEALLRPVVDFDGFARSVMANYYKSATPEQRQRFAETFKWGLVRTYALALTEFSDGEVVVLPPDKPSRSPKRESVKMEIRMNSGEVYPVLYSMAQNKQGSWVMRNIIINGVNIGLTYRSQFSSAMQDSEYGGDLDRVIDAWAELLSSEVPAGAAVDKSAAAGGASTEA